MFACLHAKSHYSPGYGTTSVDDLVRRAAECGYGALALTDVENLYGQLQFQHAARLRRIKPIAGVELRANYAPGTLGQKPRRLVLLARDQSGYESLCRIVTRRRQALGVPTEDPAGCLADNPRGLFYLSDDASVLRDLIRQGVHADDTRFLLVRPGGPPPPPDLVAVADCDAVMASPSDHALHRLLIAIRRGERVAHVEDAESPERSLPHVEKLRELFRDAPQALAEAERLAEVCALDLSRPSLSLPAVAEGATGDPYSQLERLCNERLDAGVRPGRWTEPAYAERLRSELAVIRERALGAYFLIVAAITDRAREQGIAIAGRGSAASSLVAHVLGITPVDPLKYGLYFERFIHAGRRDLPDIDLDISADRRDELIDWVFAKFWPEKVAMVSAHVHFGRRGAFRAGLKALGTPPDVVDRFCSRLPDDLAGEAYPPLNLLSPRTRRALPWLEQLAGKFQHISVHPGGIVLAEPRLDQYAPLERAPKGVLVTQYDMRSAAQAGLVKIDLLGNRALAAIEQVHRVVGHRIEMPDGDPATLDALRAGRTIGCFQVETPAVRNVLRKLPVRGVADLVAALAIVRPGPASGAAKAAFIRRANGQEPPTPPHPRLAEHLHSTFGMMLYEEDLMAAIAAFTNQPLRKADEMRAALVKAREPAEIAPLKQEFLGAAIAAGVTAHEAASFWTVLEQFVAYSFNKAHAIGYAQLAWQSAYLKTHFPAAFACAVLNTYGGGYPLRTVAADFARQGVRLLTPHVNHSLGPCTQEAGAVRIGLAAIKRVTARTRATILAHRPFADFADFLERTSLGIGQLEPLVLSGACDGLEPLRPECYPIAHEELLARLRPACEPGALAGFVPNHAAGSSGDLYRTLVRIRNEVDLLGVHVSDHPMRVLREEAGRAGCVRIEQLTNLAGQRVRIAALVGATRRLETRKGRVMQFVTLEDESGLVEAVLFTSAIKALGDPVNNPGPYLIDGVVTEEQGDVHLEMSALLPFHERPRPYARAE